MFRTEIQLTPCAQHITHSQPLLTVGSCFADVIGNRLLANKFSAEVNPFGTVYNPVSIFKLVSKAVGQTPFATARIVKSQGIYQHFDLHSMFGKRTEQELLEEIQQLEERAAKSLRKAKWLLITLGTAVVYEQPDGVVANCHKVPAAQFGKRMLSVTEVVKAYENIRSQLLQLTPELRVIITVSPVRHLKDTLVINSQSKSILRVAAAEMEAYFAEVSYFPAYEIMMDDLRDYRFYEKDMLHPNETAHDYIWEKFSEVYFSTATRQLMEQWTRLQRNLRHRPFFPESAEHRQFLRKTLVDMEQLHPQLDLTQEIDTLKKQLS